MQTIELLGSAHGWQAWSVKLGKLPLPTTERPAQADLLLRFLHTASGFLHLTPTVWIEATHLHIDQGSRLLAPNAATWAPRQGFGIDPLGELPRLWTSNDFAEAPFGHKPPVFNHQVWEVSRLSGHTSAIESLAGRGVLSLALLDGTSDDFRHGTTAALRGLVHERAFQMYSYFYPLLTREALASPELPAWMANAKLYLREIFKDGTLLLLAAVPVEDLFLRMGADRRSASEFRLQEVPQYRP